eukprot:gene9790-11599_t
MGCGTSKSNAVAPEPFTDDSPQKSAPETLALQKKVLKLEEQVDSLQEQVQYYKTSNKELDGRLQRLEKGLDDTKAAVVKVERAAPLPAPAPTPTPVSEPVPVKVAVGSTVSESVESKALAAHREAGVLDESELRFALELVKYGQGHLFREWGSPQEEVEQKTKLVKQLTMLDANYSGGLLKYISNARELLKSSKEGANPLAGWTPSVPEGTALEYGTSEFLQYEQAGVDEVGYAGFVLVAGGLGERLGFSGIKVGLPVEKVSDMTYLQFYCESILHLQKLFNDKHGTDRQLPFAIMTSEDTHAATEALLATNGYFGMQEGQVQLMKQEKVPCLADNDAALACKPGSPFTVLTKPHGHGDVHSLMHTKGIAAQWRTSGVKW